MYVLYYAHRHGFKTERNAIISYINKIPVGGYKKITPVTQIDGPPLT